MRLWLALAAACCASAQDPPILFRERVNLVTVPVVVRDRQGRSVGSLTREDFQLFDRGKPQTISRFSVEASSKAGAVVDGPGVMAAGSRSVLPERYIAYVFDDLHTEFGDLARVRDAAWEHMRESLGEGDRAAIYTTSGQTIEEFTDDRDKLHATLLNLTPKPQYSRTYADCPDLSHYQADLIINRNDHTALASAVQETIACAGLDHRIAEVMARATASRVFSMGNQGTRIALHVLRQVVKRMAAAPGQRVVLLASPGFVSSQENFTRNEIIDQAIKANVTINGLDARGLWVDSIFDARRPFSAAGNRQKTQIEREAQRVSSDIVADLAHGTGGTFLQNSNDLAGGFRKLADSPEQVYVLGFSPENLKPDGSFHPLKVKVRSEARLTASTRRGYYAPKQAASPEETAKEEILRASFSREEQREIPVEVNASGARSAEGKTELRLEVRVPLSALRYQVAGDLNTNPVTLVYAIFDRNGRYVTGEESRVDLKVKTETLEKPGTSMNVRTTWAVQPGVYAVRVVVRDSEDRHLTALNATVEVP